MWQFGWLVLVRLGVTGKPLLEERAQHEQITREERERLATEAAALATQADEYTHVAETSVPTSDLEVRFPRHVEREVDVNPVAHDEISTDETSTDEIATDEIAADEIPTNEIPLDESSTDEIEDDEEPPPSTFLLASPVATEQSAPQPVLRESPPRHETRPLHERLAARWQRSWNVPAAAIALLLLIGITVFALSRGHDTSARTTSTAAVATRIVDSAGGNVYESVVPLPRIVTDTGVLSARATDWTPPPKRRAPPPERARVRAEAPVEQTTPAIPDPAAEFLGISRPPIDSARVGLPVPMTPTPNRPIRRESTLARDTLRTPLAPLPFNIPAPVRRDSLPRPDTTARTDSTFRR